MYYASLGFKKLFRSFFEIIRELISNKRYSGSTPNEIDYMSEVERYRQ
jgi:hypothetical protein